MSVIAIEDILVIKRSSDCDSCESSVASSILEEPIKVIKPYLQPLALRALASKVDLVIGFIIFPMIFNVFEGLSPPPPGGAQMR